MFKRSILTLILAQKTVNANTQCTEFNSVLHQNGQINFIDNIPDISASDCCNACSANAACQGWSKVDDPGLNACYLYSTPVDGSLVFPFSVSGNPGNPVATSFTPTLAPTMSPTDHPSLSPTMSPTDHPTESPTMNPTDHPSLSPTMNPTDHPTESPTLSPTMNPTDHPTENPSLSSTMNPTVSPTDDPTDEATSNYLPNNFSITPPNSCSTSIHPGGGTVECTFSWQCTVASNEYCALFTSMEAGPCSASSFTNTQVDNSGSPSSTTDIDFTDTDDGCDPNSGSCTFAFCARADLFAGESGYDVSLTASLLDVTASVTFDSTGAIGLANVVTTQFGTDDANTGGSRNNLQIFAFRAASDCDDIYVPQTSAPEMEIGQTAAICLQPRDGDVIIEGISNVVAGSQTLVDANGTPIFFTHIFGQGPNFVLQTILVSAYFDEEGGAATTLTISGTAHIRYTSGLGLSRRLQTREEDAKFVMDVKLTKVDEATGSEHSSAHRIGAGLFTIAATLFIV